MKVGATLLLLVAGGTALGQNSSPAWSPAKAAAYLDGRTAWWMTRPKSARDHGTFCTSCHTAAPIALGRPALHHVLGEKTPPATERKLLDNITTRVRRWNEVEPFYSDQTSGVPKTSESRGTESILNALILVWNDLPAGRLSPDARLALENMWALQLKSGDMSGSWAWLQFHNAPWEGDSQFYGAALAWCRWEDAHVATTTGAQPNPRYRDPRFRLGFARQVTHCWRNNS